MKNLTFNKNSWHFWLATRIADYHPPHKFDDDDKFYGDSGDICTYTKYVLGAIVLSTICIILGIAITALIGTLLSHLMLGIIFSLITGTFFFTEIGVASLIVAFSWCLYGLIIWISNRKIIESKNKSDGFIQHAFRSWKHKFCVQINFVDKSEDHDDNLRAGQ